MEETFRRCGSAAPVPDLAAVFDRFSAPCDGDVYKCHLTYDISGRVLPPVFEKYSSRRIDFLVCRDADGLDYSCKWEDRSGLESLGKGLEQGGEVLILRNGFVTDTRYSNLVFGDGVNWVTPDTFLLPGTNRAFLLHTGLIQSVSIRKGEWGEFPYCSLINAMLDPGDVVLETSKIGSSSKSVDGK